MRLPKRIGLAALCAAWGIAFAAHASVALVDVTYTGLATGGDSNVFGSNQSYVNTPFVVDYTFLYSGLPGGDGAGGLLSVAITINGTTVSFSPTAAAPIGGINSNADHFGNGGDVAIAGYARSDSAVLYYRNSENPFNYLFLGISNVLTSELVPDDPTEAFSATGANAPGLATIWNRLMLGGTLGVGAGFTFVNQSVTVTSDSPALGIHGVGAVAIPEPTTWALMIGGFFGLGAAVRRRRPVGATA
jgi:hypothetical protein